jgi:hypothetical protein
MIHSHHRSTCQILPFSCMRLVKGERIENTILGCRPQHPLRPTHLYILLAKKERKWNMI